MKTFFYSSLLMLMFTIIGCSGSGVYRKNWKAMDKNGNKWDMNFSEKSFTIKNEKGITETYEYVQTTVKIENATRSYGIKLKDGRAFRITFPLPNDQSKGIINNEASSEALYTIGRNEYAGFAELLKF